MVECIVVVPRKPKDIFRFLRKQSGFKSSQQCGRGSTDPTYRTERSDDISRNSSNFDNPRNCNDLSHSNDSTVLHSMRRRRVRFEFDDDNSHQLKTHVCTYQGPATEEEEAACYYTKTQMQQRKKEAMAQAEQYARENPQYLETLESLFNTPLKVNSLNHRVIATSMGTMSIATTSTEQQAKEHAFRIFVGESEIRGSESRLSQLMIRHKKYALMRVLGRQKHLLKQKEDNNETISYEEMAGNLRLCCEQINQCTRDFALQLAMADQFQAQNP